MHVLLSDCVHVRVFVDGLMGGPGAGCIEAVQRLVGVAGVLLLSSMVLTTALAS